MPRFLRCVCHRFREAQSRHLISEVASEPEIAQRLLIRSRPFACLRYSASSRRSSSRHGSLRLTMNRLSGSYSRHVSRSLLFCNLARRACHCELVWRDDDELHSDTNCVLNWQVEMICRRLLVAVSRWLPQTGPQLERDVFHPAASSSKVTPKPARACATLW